MLKFCTMLLTVVLVLGCATSTQDSLDRIAVLPPAVEAGHRVQECDTHKRDLTVAWELRQYWCGKINRQPNLQNVNDRLVVKNKPQLIAQAHKPKSSWYGPDALASKIDNTIAAPIMVGQITPIENPATHSDLPKPGLLQSSPSEATVASEPAPETPADVDSDGPQATRPNPEASTNKSTTATKSTTASIPFGRLRRVLGPRGRAKTQSLIDRVKNADSIKLLGLFTDDEVTLKSNNEELIAIYREILAVSRALAVMRYWKERGIDTSKIKILHHRRDLSSREVKVHFSE